MGRGVRGILGVFRGSRWGIAEEKDQTVQLPNLNPRQHLPLPLDRLSSPTAF